MDARTMIDWPPGRAAKLAREPDTRMLRCLLRGYIDCAAKCPDACVCNKLSSAQYIDQMEAKYGKAQP